MLVWDLPGTSWDAELGSVPAWGLGTHRKPGKGGMVQFKRSKLKTRRARVYLFIMAPAILFPYDITHYPMMCPGQVPRASNLMKSIRILSGWESENFSGVVLAHKHQHTFIPPLCAQHGQQGGISPQFVQFVVGLLHTVSEE